VADVDDAPALPPQEQSLRRAQRQTPLFTGYLDAASGLPLHPVAVEALEVAAEDGWADPTKLTGPGRRSAVLLDAARATVAEEFGVYPDEVSFVPSGIHALHLGVLGTLAGRSRRGRTLVHSAVEHSAVLKAAEWHREQGGTVQVVGVDAEARVDVAEFVAASTAAGVAAAALQAANHEVGTRQPTEAIAAALAEVGVPLVVDATHEAVFGDLPSAPVFTADARMWGGPSGVGILVVRRGTRWRSPFPADDAEFGRSPGVVGVAAAVAAAAALRATRAHRLADATRLADLIDRIRAEVPRSVPDSVVLGAGEDRLPHIVTFSCLYLDGEAILTELDRRGFVVSSGSSCTSDTLTPSHVLVAMGALTSGNVRVSLNSATSEADIERFLAELPASVAAVRASLPADAGPRQPTTVPEVGSGAVSDAGLVVDSRGRRCPLPVLDLARAMPAVPVGAVVTVLADDPAAASDIAAWTRMRGQELLTTEDQGDGSAAYRVRRAH
jgi:cysteine desulfurase